MQGVAPDPAGLGSVCMAGLLLVVAWVFRKDLESMIVVSTIVFITFNKVSGTFCGGSTRVFFVL